MLHTNRLIFSPHGAIQPMLWLLLLKYQQAERRASFLTLPHMYWLFPERTSSHLIEVLLAQEVGEDERLFAKYGLLLAYDQTHRVSEQYHHVHLYATHA